MPEERIVAGLRCSEVLDRLSDFVDGELEADARQRVLDHIAACNWCEEFGGRFSALVGTLRRARSSESLDEDVAARLEEYLARSIGR